MNQWRPPSKFQLQITRRNQIFGPFSSPSSSSPGHSDWLISMRGDKFNALEILFNNEFVFLWLRLAYLPLPETQQPATTTETMTGRHGAAAAVDNGNARTRDVTPRQTDGSFSIQPQAEQLLVTFILWFCWPLYLLIILSPGRERRRKGTSPIYKAGPASQVS